MPKKPSAAKAASDQETPPTAAITLAPVERDDSLPENNPRPAYSSRASAIRDLASKNRDKRDDDLREEGLEVVDTRGTPPATAPAPGDDAAAAARDDADETGLGGDVPAATDEPDSPAAAPDAAAPAKKKFVIDGNTVELTEEEITRHVQKSATADQRLAEATRLLEGAKRVTPAATRENGGASPQPSAPSADAATPLSDQDVESLAKTILFGTQEEVTGALKKALGGGRQASADMAQRMTTQIQGMTTEQVTHHVRETIAWESAQALFDKPADQGGYSDIWSDTVLKNEFIRREDELRDGGDKRPYAVVHAEIAKGVREWRDGLIKAHAPKSGLENRDSLKRSAGVVRGAGGAVPPAQQESRPKTHEEKLDGMRAARGQR